MRRTPKVPRRTLPATVLTVAAVASLIGAGSQDTPPPKKPQRHTYVAGGVWGGG